MCDMDDGWKGNHPSWCHLYLVSEDVDLRDVVGFLCGDSTQREVQNKQELFVGDMDTLYSSDWNDFADDTMCRNTIIVAIMGERDVNSAIELWPYCSIDAAIEKDHDKISA